MTLLRRLVSATALRTACAIAGALLAASVPAQRAPNLIVILADDLGYADVGCYGSKQVRTPHLDRMAREGRKLTDFYAAAPVCTPSRAGLLTGCYPARVGLARGVLRPDSRRGLHPDEITVAELVRGRGYATGCIGKWHLGCQPGFLPTDQGFDQYCGLYHNPDEPEAGRFADGVPWIDNGAERATPDCDELVRRCTREAIGFIDAHADKPFFLYLAHPMPQVPPGASPWFRSRSRKGLDADVVEEIDASTGAILARIRELGLAQDTLVVFTSDNGPSGRAAGSAAPLRGRKNTVFEQSMRVPCIVWAPGRVPPDTTSHGLATMLDILPVCAALAGAEPADRAIDGIDIRPILFGEPGAASPRSEFFYFDSAGKLRGVRSGKWRMVRARRSAKVASLFDLTQDLGAGQDVASEHPKVTADLSRRSREFLAQLARATRPVGRAEIERPVDSREAKVITVTETAGRWRLTDASGTPFFSLGVQRINTRALVGRPNEERAREAFGPSAALADGEFEPTEDAVDRIWRHVERLAERLGFDTFGPGTSGLPTHRTSLRFRYIAALPRQAIPPDVFDPQALVAVDRQIAETTKLHRDRPNLIGWLLADEIRVRPQDPVHPWVSELMRLPADAPGKRAWLRVLRRHHATAEEAGTVYGLRTTAWEEIAAQRDWRVPANAAAASAHSRSLLVQIAWRWYRFVHEALRRHAPANLILSPARRATEFPGWITEIFDHSCDVLVARVSAGSQGSWQQLRRLHQRTSMPILGVGRAGTFETRHAAAIDYAERVKSVCQLPFVVGWHECALLQTAQPRGPGYRTTLGLLKPFADAPPGYIRVLRRAHIAVRELFGH